MALRGSDLSRPAPAAAGKQSPWIGKWAQRANASSHLQSQLIMKKHLNLIVKSQISRLRNFYHMKKILLSAIILIHSLLGPALYAQKPNGDLLKLSGSGLELFFSKNDGGFCGMTSGENHITAIRKTSDSQPVWEMALLDPDNRAIRLLPNAFGQFRSSFEGSEKLILTWSKPTTNTLPASLVVTAEVKLASYDHLSYWDLKVTGLKELALENVQYPIISGISASKTSRLATPSWMGHLITDPIANLSKRGDKTHRMVYPGGMSMQFLTVYEPQGKGFYAACNDSESFQKDFILRLNKTGEMVYQTVGFPEFSYQNNSYTIPYQTVIGAYEGDWFTAAEIYRRWAIKQEWTQNARLKNGLTPSWLDSTALWIWNRGRTNEVLEPAEKIHKTLGLPVSVLWHWWHRSSYDDTFPDYIPPRDGAERFTKEVNAAREQGINAIVYMNQLQWARSTPSWSAENALLSAAKNRDGSTTDHVFNIFTGKSLTNMCIAAVGWRNKYASLADTVLNRYKVSGIYMDQACISRMCYDTTHGHKLGGGNYWMHGSGELARQVRSVVAPDRRGQIMLSGEGVGESWLPYQDAFLALQVSMERYSGIGAEPIPLFQAVYHPYSVIYGSYSSLLKPPYDEMWPDADRPNDALGLLDEQYNRQFMMEQARSFVWGMQPMLSNYQEKLDNSRKKELQYLYQMVRVRNKALKFLFTGEMMKNIEIDPPTENINISKLSIYAGQKEKVTHFEKAYPTLYTSVWRSEDQMLGVAAANIADTGCPLPVSLKLDKYGIHHKTGNVYLISETGKRKLPSFTDGKIDLELTIPGQTVWFLEIEPIE